MLIFRHGSPFWGRAHSSKLLWMLHLTSTMREYHIRHHFTILYTTLFSWPRKHIDFTWQSYIPPRLPGTEIDKKCISLSSLNIPDVHGMFVQHLHSRLHIQWPKQLRKSFHLHSTQWWKLYSLFFLVQLTGPIIWQPNIRSVLASLKTFTIPSASSAHVNSISNS